MASGLRVCIGLTVWALIVPAWYGADEKPAHSAVTPVSKKDEPWQSRHKSFLELAKKGGVDVVFLGDSLTQGWEVNGQEVWKAKYEPLKAVNLGMSGDLTEHILWRITEGKELAGLKPRLVVVQAGTNNLGADRQGQFSAGGNTPEQIADGVGAIVKEVRRQLPEARVLVIGILPRAADAEAPVRAKIKAVNKLLTRLSDDKQVRVTDVAASFLSKDGGFSEDLSGDAFHLTPQGYKILAEALQPALDELLQKASN